MAVFIIAFLAFKGVAVWTDWLPADEYNNPEYGERIYPNSVFRTRMNTWSNLSCILFNFYVIALGINDWKKGLSLVRLAKIHELDMQDSFTSPGSIFQGHAVWHLVSSLYYFFIYLYFRSEERGRRTA